MVIHEAIGMAEPMVALVDLVENGEKVLPILILPVNKLFSISPRGDMIHSTGIFDTQRASHSRTLSDDLTKVKHYRPDPSCVLTPVVCST